MNLTNSRRFAIFRLINWYDYMVSVNKKKKLKNSYCVPSELKNKEKGPRRIAFFTSSLRKKIKNENGEED